MTADELAERLHAKRNGAGWHARCPAHDDHTPSLSISAGRHGGVVLHCHAGCPVDAVCAALGLTVADLMPDENPRDTNGHPEIAATYDYTDPAGALLFQVVRTMPKGFRQRRPAPHGGWFWNLGDTPKVLFRLPQVLAAVQTGETVYITEGEKDALTLEGWGLVATTNPGGAGKWRPDYSACLDGAHVVILPDQDGPGRAHADQVAKALEGIASTIRIAPPLPDAKDVTEWAVKGGSKRALLELLTPAPPYFYLSELFRRPELLEPPPCIVPRFAWEGRVTLLAAREKVGKSTLMGQAVAALAAAPTEFMGEAIPGPHKTLWVGIDEPLGDIVRRLDRYDLNAPTLADRVAVRNLKPAAADLIRWIKEEDFRLIVLDHLTSYAMGRIEDTNKAIQYTPIMQELSGVARETGAGMVVLHHSAKGGGYRDSTAIGAQVDVIIVMRRDLNEQGEEGDEQNGLKRHFTCAGRVPVSHAFTTEYQGGYQMLMQSGLPLDQQILRYVGANPGCSGRDVRGAVGGRTLAVTEKLAELARNGLLCDRGTTGKAKWYTAIVEQRQS